MGDDDCCKSKTESDESVSKVKNYLWCSSKSDKYLENFANLGDAVRKVKNQALTKAYFHPSSLSSHSDTSNFGEFAQSVIDSHVVESSLFKPPSWFVELSKKQVSVFIKLFELIERSQTTATDNKIAKALESLNLGFSASDLRDLKDIYEIRNLANLDFEEFVYSLASIDQVKKIVNRTDDASQGRPEFSQNQAVLYSAIVQFTVAACCVCSNITLEGVNADIRKFFDCKLVCMDRLSNCLYDKLKSQFTTVPNYQCSPYYDSLKYFRQAMNTCSKGQYAKSDECKRGSTLNPYLYHMAKNKVSEKVITEEIIKGVFDTYTKNGCIITSLPDAQWIPIIRMLIARLSIFEPICCSARRRDNIQKVLRRYKDNIITRMKKMKQMKEMQGKKIKLVASRTKVTLRKPCQISIDEAACFTPAVYSRLIKKVRNLDLENRQRMFEAEAARNRTLKYQIDFSMFPNESGIRFEEIFELYNPTDARKFHIDMSDPKVRKARKVDKVQDPDVF